jgi:methyltransferase (TIGR00027 family)
MVVSQLTGNAVSWQEDYANRVNPSLMTRLLHEAIPVLRWVDWRVTEVEEGLCTSELPLSYATTNQHGTHQAALISLSADYTGGLALATLLRGVPLAGVHPCTEEHSASLWLAAMDVRYKSPSTGHLRATCRISEEIAQMVRQRYFSGKRVLVTLPVIFTSNDELVAEAQMKYFAQPSIQLKPTRENPAISPLFKHKLKASARMIAGLRASADETIVRVDNAHERHAAGPHGELLARRLQGILPQLQHMVAARTKHIDEILAHIPGLRQVVLLGIGLDMRPFRSFQHLGRPMFFEMDLPEMLEERTRVISQMKDRPFVRRRMIATDFKKDHVGELLMKHPDFDPRVPTVVVYEGCTMYFGEQENLEVLRSVSQILEHPDCRLWCDMVTRSVVDGTTQIKEIANFVKGMEQLGESFIFGCDDPVAFLARCGFSKAWVTSAQDYLGSEDATFSAYRFVVAKP